MAHEYDTAPIRVGIVGARGYAGSEFAALIAAHPVFRLSFAASRSQAGETLEIPGVDTDDDPIVMIDADPGTVAAQDADAVVLAVPDGATDPYVERLGETVVLDLSADHRFDDGWAYGLSERDHARVAGSKRISNPGCYATAVQLAAYPILSLIEGPIHAFGVSGYSGAGTTPSERNDPERLGGGVTPYKVAGHTHEREIARHLGRGARFSPCVAPYFRGIVATVQATLREGVGASDVIAALESAYAQSVLVRVAGTAIPRVQDIVCDPGAVVGGVTVGASGRDLALVCTIDNLLKGAASQAVQNLNAAFGLPSELGLAQGVMA